MPRIVKDNAHGADGKRKPSKDNTDEASELVYRMVLPHPHGLVFLPTSSVRFETGQIAQPKKEKKKEKKKVTHPHGLERSQLPAPREGRVGLLHSRAEDARITRQRCANPHAYI